MLVKFLIKTTFSIKTVSIKTVSIKTFSIETVRSHKALGLIIQNNLKWNEQISSVVAKASKRLHILRVLSRGGVPASDLTKIYYALIRPVLECCCPVWSNSIPTCLSDELERVRKRAMRIIYPDQLYDKALQLANCKRLTERRNEICMRTLKKIVEEEGGPLTEHVTLTRALTHRHFIRNFNNLSLYIQYVGLSVLKIVFFQVR